MPSPMDVDETHTFSDAVTERAWWQEWIHLERLERDCNTSVMDESVTSGSASDSPSENTRPTTLDDSELESNAHSYDPGQDDIMRVTVTSAGDRSHPRVGDQDDSILIPVLIDEHKQSNVVDVPQTLPPSGRLVTRDHTRASRRLAPRMDGQAITSWRDGSPPRTETPQGRSPRARIVLNPAKTAIVRAKGSCYHCSTLKVACDVGTPCDRCVRWAPEHADRVCNRTDLDALLRSAGGSIGPVDGGRWMSGDYQQAIQRARPEEHFYITVRLSLSDLPGLQIRVAKHADGNFRIDCSNFEAEILAWVESDLLQTSSGDFQRSIASFLWLYSKGNCIERKSLVDSVVRMSSLWRLISASEFWYVQGSSVARLPDSIATQLKHFAQRKMASAEEKVIDEMGHIIVPNGFNKKYSDTPAVWACVWSVTLLYRQALQMLASKTAVFKDGFRDVTGKLLDAYVVALHDLFRVRKVHDSLDNIHQLSFLGNHVVTAAYEQARRERRSFYQGLQPSNCQGDDLIEACVVDTESKVEKRRPRGGRQNPTEEVYIR